MAALSLGTALGVDETKGWGTVKLQITYLPQGRFVFDDQIMHPWGGYVFDAHIMYTPLG